MVDLDQHGPAFPGGPAFSEERIVALVEQRRHLRGPLLEILHAIDDELGFVDERVIPILARELNLSRAEVHGVVTFYRDFRTEPPPAHTLRLCRAEACQSMGAERLVAHAEASLGTRVGGRTADGAIGLEQVFCLGNCALSPAALLDGRLVGRVDEARLDALVARVRNTDREEPGSSAAPPSSRSDRPGRRGTIVYVPRDAAAGSVGADEVADVLARGATARGLELSVVRNGSRGMFWLEPLVEVATPSGRVAYGPVDPGRVDELLDAGLLEGAPHELFLGATDELPWLARQTRLTFCRVGVTDPLSPEDYEEHGGLAGLRKALAMDPGAIVDEVTASGLRGRGGAGFPAGIKWSTVQNAPTPDVKFVCCNADEGDSGTFADRMLLEGDPFLLVEGMTIAGLAVGAVEGYLYVRSEYPEAVATMRTAIEIAYLRGWLGEHVLGSDRSFDLSLRVGAGAYICGEETAMLESLEGRRGVIRAKPPLPAVSGLHGRPTVVNNVLTLAAVPWILAQGASAYAALGYGRSTGTQVFQLAGNVAHGGIVEVAFGITLGELVQGFGGGTRTGRPVRAVQVGGPLGSYLPPERFDLPMDYEAFAAAGAMVGHGGVVVFDDTADMARQARFAMEFCAEESCGKCTPCRVGAVRGVEVIDRMIAGEEPLANLELLRDLCDVMVSGSLCAMGGLTPMPVRSVLDHFIDDFHIPGQFPDAGRRRAGG